MKSTHIFLLALVALLVISPCLGVKGDDEKNKDVKGKDGDGKEHAVNILQMAKGTLDKAGRTPRNPTSERILLSVFAANLIVMLFAMDIFVQLGVALKGVVLLLVAYSSYHVYRFVDFSLGTGLVKTTDRQDWIMLNVLTDALVTFLWLSAVVYGLVMLDWAGVWDGLTGVGAGTWLTALGVAIIYAALYWHVQGRLMDKGLIDIDWDWIFSFLKAEEKQLEVVVHAITEGDDAKGNDAKV